MMGAKPSVVVLGLPGSGKTTFLAALWHIVTERDVDTVLQFAGLKLGEARHLNRIAIRWRDAVAQERTALSGGQSVSMNLLAEDSSRLQVTFPDLPGEAFQRMWEERECEETVAQFLRATGVLLFVHSDTIRRPQWVLEEATLSDEIGSEMPTEDEQVYWDPSLAPTQVQLVDILQMLHSRPLDVGPRKLAIMMSAWDKVEEQGCDPRELLGNKMPLLHQYVTASTELWATRVYGISAQGGDYDGDYGREEVEEASVLRRRDTASERIVLVDGELVGNDLTEPIAWLMK